MKIVILDGYAENPGDLSWEGFEMLGEVAVYDRTPINDEDMIASRIGAAEIVLTNKTPVSRSVMGACPGIKYIGVLATGYNIVDVEAAAERNIAVTNVPVYGTNAVGQFAIALLLEVCHHIGHHSGAVSNGAWQRCPDWCFWDYPLIELEGKTMGIIGFGRIGRTTARIASALGMEILAYDINMDASLAKGLASYVSLDDLFARSDVICLHCPVFPETAGIICKESIKKMKDGVIIINNSRGQLIVEQDLADALNSGKVYAAGLDVVQVEPILSDNPLLGAKNCIITPHISWAPKESRKRLMDVAVDNLRKFLDGTPANLICV